MKRGICFFAVGIVLACAAFGQMAERFDALLSSEALSYGEAAAFVLQAADRIAPTDLPSSQAEASRFAEGLKLAPSATAKLDGVALLIMKAFDMKGGAFYSIFQNPHYAYRELQYRNFIEGKTAPGMAVSGDLLVFIINRILSQQEDFL
jgi:hypothetical protein